MIFDTHAHYNDSAYDNDRDELIRGFLSQGVGAVVNIGTDMETSEITASMTEKYENVYGAVGVFPSDTECLEKPENVKRLKELVREHAKVVAIGEIGLDYHYEDTDRAMQQKWFRGQMDIARELKVPIVVHSRDAAKDTVDIMRDSGAQDIGGVIHCYSYTKETAREFLNMGFYFGIGGVLTFKNARKLKEAVEYIPMDSIVLETDSPYLTPEPFRGKRNNSANIVYVAEKIAEIKNISTDSVYDITWNNALRLYKIA